MNAYDSPYSPYGFPQGDDWASAMTVDADENVYITGTCGNRHSERSTYRYEILKYDMNGVLQWVATYSDPSREDIATAIAVDANGNVYVTGYSRVEADYDYVTVEYDSAGVQQWVARYSAPAGGVDVATAVAIDSSENAYVTGDSRGAYATIKYDTNGVQLA